MTEKELKEELEKREEFLKKVKEFFFGLYNSGIILEEIYSKVLQIKVKINEEEN